MLDLINAMCCNKSLGAYVSDKFKLHLIKIISTIDIFKGKKWRKKKSNVNLPKYIHYISICSVLNNWTCIYLCFLTIFSCLAYAISFFYVCVKIVSLFLFLTESGKKNLLLRCFDSNTNGTRSLGFFFSVLLDSFNDWLNTNLKKFCELFFRMLPRLITFNLKCFIENKLAQKRK